MRVTDVLFLITEEQTTDGYGDPVITKTSRRIFCSVASIGQREFYQAAATGLKPEIKFIMADYLDYRGEKLVEHDGKIYHVLRTFRNGQELELTCYSEVNPS